MITRNARLESNRARSRTAGSSCMAVAAAGLLCLVGCAGDDSSGPPTAPVSGTVTLDGQPLPNAEVHFTTDEFAGYGLTDENGKYELVQGAAVGSNRVFISKVELPEGFDLNPDEGMDLEQLRAAGGVDENVDVDAELDFGELIPPEYSDPEQSVLDYDVPAEGTESADFRL